MPNLERGRAQSNHPKRHGYDIQRHLLHLWIRRSGSASHGFGAYNARHDDTSGKRSNISRHAKQREFGGSGHRRNRQRRIGFWHIADNRRTNDQRQRSIHINHSSDIGRHWYTCGYEFDY
jgi:hypothetical protein